MIGRKFIGTLKSQISKHYSTSNLLNQFPDRLITVIDNRKEKKIDQTWFDNNKHNEPQTEQEKKTVFAEVRHQGLFIPIFANYFLLYLLCRG